MGSLPTDSWPATLLAWPKPVLLTLWMSSGGGDPKTTELAQTGVKEGYPSNRSFHAIGNRDREKSGYRAILMDQTDCPKFPFKQDQSRKDLQLPMAWCPDEESTPSSVEWYALHSAITV